VCDTSVDRARNRRFARRAVTAAPLKKALERASSHADARAIDAHDRGPHRSERGVVGGAAVIVVVVRVDVASREWWWIER